MVSADSLGSDVCSGARGAGSLGFASALGISIDEAEGMSKGDGAAPSSRFARLSSI